MPIKDIQGDLSQTGSGAFDGLPRSDIDADGVIVVHDTQTGGSGSQGGGISTNRTSEDH